MPMCPSDGGSSHKRQPQQLFEAQKAQQELNMLVKESLDKLLRAIGRGSTTIQ